MRLWVLMLVVLLCGCGIQNERVCDRHQRLGNAIRLSEREARLVAKQAANDSEYDVDEYHVTCELVENGWRLFYKRRELGPYDGGDNHFTVIVEHNRNTYVIGGM